MKIRDIALARSGDKGNRATLSLIAYDPADYARLERALTAERVLAHYQGVVHGAVQCFPLPHPQRFPGAQQRRPHEVDAAGLKAIPGERLPQRTRPLLPAVHGYHDDGRSS